MDQQFEKCTIDTMNEIEAKRLLKKFAKFRSLIILPFGFMRNTKIVEGKIINCYKWIFYKWRVSEQVTLADNISPSKYKTINKDYANRMKHLPDKFDRVTREYVIPGTEDRVECNKCSGRRWVICSMCDGERNITCDDCDGTREIEERTECPACHGEGKIRTRSTISRRAGDDLPYRRGVELETEEQCLKCLGEGQVRYRHRCGLCNGTGKIKCTHCGGSGKEVCSYCEGKGSVLNVKIAKLDWIPSGQPDCKWYKPDYLPEKYLNKTRGQEMSPAHRQSSGNIVERRRVVRFRVQELKYSLGDKTYSLHEVEGKWRFNEYPKSTKKLITFIVSLPISILILAFLALFDQADYSSSPESTKRPIKSLSKIPIWVRGAVFALVVVIIVAVLAIYFWPSAVPVLANSPWPMFHHDLQHTGRSPYSGSADPHFKWNCDVGNKIQSAPTIGTDGTIYVGSYDKNLYALSADGTLKWVYTTIVGIYGEGIRSSPAVGNNNSIYVGSVDGNLYALNPRDGSLKWRYTTGHAILSSPAIGADGTIYVGSYDNKLYAIKPDGSFKWSFTTGGFIYSSPAIGVDGTIYFGSYDKYLYAVKSDGSLRWKYLTGDFIDSSPAIGADGTVYVGSFDHNLYAINAHDGSLKRTFTTGDRIYSSPAIGADGTIYVGSYDGTLYAIDPVDVSLKWKCSTGSPIWYSSPAVGADGTIYVGSSDGKVYAINPDNGSIRWALPIGDSISYSSPAIGPNGNIYIGSDDGRLYAIGGN